MSVRTALIGGISFLLIFSSAILAFVGIHEIRDSVVREAQSRVAHDLSLLRSLYDSELTLSAERLQAAVDRRLAGSEAIDWRSPARSRELSQPPVDRGLQAFGAQGQLAVVQASQQ